MENFDLPLLVTYAKWMVIGIGGLYILAAFGLSMLAARLRQPHAWIAWVPLVNLYLLCRLAKSTPFLILLAIIPVINLFVFAYLGARIAARAGKSGMLGALLGFPVLGAAVPLLLAIGGNNPPQPDGTQAPAASPFVYALINAGVAVCLLVFVGIGFRLAGNMTKAVVPTAEQATASLPQRMAGTLTEFPIDTDTDNPALPANVVTENYPDTTVNGGQFPVRVTPKQLPPWINPDSLPSIAENAISADYHSANTAASVSVVTLAMRDNDALTPPTQAQLAELGAGARVSGVELQSAAGIAYSGYHVSSTDSNYYALRRADTNTAVIISANDAAGAEVAERLASNIGNGQGLLEYNQYRSSFGQIPSTPDGAKIEFMQTYTENDIALMVEQANQEIAGEDIDPEVASMIEMARAIVPSNVSLAAYTTSQPEKMYGAAVAGYSSSTISWTALQTLGVLQSIIPGQIPADVMADIPFSYTLAPIELGDSSGYAFDITSKDDGMTGGGILLRQGATLVLMGGTSATSQELLPWAKAYLMGR